MKRVFLAGMFSCCSCLSQAQAGLEYYREPPKDSSVPEEYQKKRSALRDDVWSVDNLTQTNEQVIEREQQRERVEATEKQAKAAEKQERCRREHSRDPSKKALCDMASHNFYQP